MNDPLTLRAARAGPIEIASLRSQRQQALSLRGSGATSNFADGPDWLSAAELPLEYTPALQVRKFAGVYAEPVLQHLGTVAPQCRRRLQAHRLAVDPHRPGRHLVVALALGHDLHDAALVERRLVLQLHRVEHRASRHADRNELLHRVALVVLAGPFANDRVEFLLVGDAVVAGGEARILDQFLAADQLHQARPVLGVGPAGGQVDIVIGAAALGRVEARGRVVAAARLGAVARRRLAGALHRAKTGAHVVDHRVLHRQLQPPALAGAVALVQGAEDRRRHQHAGAGVAEAQARLDRRPVGLAGDADRAAGGLRDHIEGQPRLVRAAAAKALDLAIDDPRVDFLDGFVVEAEALDRAGRHVLDRDVGLLQQFLDDLEPLWRLQIDRQRLLVDVELVEIPGVVIGLAGPQPAAGIAASRVLDLDHLRAEPGQDLGRGRARLELGEVHHLDALQEIEILADVTHLRLL